MDFFNRFELLSRSDRKKIQKMCHLLSGEITKEDIEECFDIHERLIDSDDCQKDYKMLTIEFALYTLLGIKSIDEEAMKSVKSVLSKIYYYFETKGAI